MGCDSWRRRLKLSRMALTCLVSDYRCSLRATASSMTYPKQLVLNSQRFWQPWQTKLNDRIINLRGRTFGKRNSSTMQGIRVTGRAVNAGRTPANQRAARTSANQGAARTSANHGAARTSANQRAARTSANQGAARTSANHGAARTSANQGAARTSANQGAARTSVNQGSRGGMRTTGQMGHGGAALRTGAPCITINTRKAVEPGVRRNPKVPAASIYEIEESAKWNPRRSGVAPCTVKRLITSPPRNKKPVHIWKPCENPRPLEVSSLLWVWCAVGAKGKVPLANTPFAVVAQLAFEGADPQNKEIPESYSMYMAYAPGSTIFP